MSKDMDINYICDQCQLKGTQVPLKSWDPVFLISDKGYYEEEKNKVDNKK